MRRVDGAGMLIGRMDGTWMVTASDSRLAMREWRDR